MSLGNTDFLTDSTDGTADVLGKNECDWCENLVDRFDCLSWFCQEGQSKMEVYNDLLRVMWKSFSPLVIQTVEKIKEKPHR